MAYMPLLALQTSGIEVGDIGSIFGFLGIVQFFMIVPMGRIADLRGKQGITTLGLLVIAGSFIGFAVGSSSRWLLVSALAYGFGRATYDPTSSALLSEGVAQEQQGVIFGAVSAMENMGIAIGPLIAGYLWLNWGPESPFMFGGLVVGLGILFWLVFQKKVFSHGTALPAEIFIQTK